jgi:cobalt/nickel transport protein
MRKILCVCLGLLWISFSSAVWAHFGMVIPSDTMVMPDDDRSVNIKLSFSHPMEGRGMELKKPAAFKAVRNGKETDLLDRLEETRVMGAKAWQIDYTLKRPGVYTFYMEPKPFWEPAEDCFIVHYTKTVIAAFGYEEGWDNEIGLKTEIVPLSRPFGLYAGNLFQGIVKLNGNPVPYAGVEVEYYNKEGDSKAPNAYMITQSIKADKNGVFSYAVPKDGWWGFAALNTAEEKMEHDCEAKEIELGAVIWVRFHKWMSP